MIPLGLLVPIISGTVQIVVKVLELTLKPTEKFSPDDQWKIAQRVEKNGKILVASKPK